MSLRARLILAFLLLSVVPLTAVTAQHYVSSLDTLHRVARRDAEQLTMELGQRMEIVKADLSHRVERAWEDSRPRRLVRRPPSRPVQNEVRDAALTGVADALGETALLLERIEFRTAPVPPAPPGARVSLPAQVRTSRPSTPAKPALGTVVMPSAPAAPAPPAPGADAEASAAAGPSAASRLPARTEITQMHPEAFVVDMKAMRAELERAGVKVDQWTPEVERMVARGIGIGATAAAKGLKLSAGMLQKMDEQRAAEAALQARLARGHAKETKGAKDATDKKDARDAIEPKPVATQTVEPAEPRDVPVGTSHVAHASFSGGGEGLDVTMQRDGKPVGQVNAKLRLNRVLSTVVSNTRRENGEIAFAIDPKGAIVADTPEERATIERMGIGLTSDAFLRRDGWIIVTRDDPAGSGARFGIARRIGDSVRDLRVAAGRDLATGLGVISLALIGIFPISGRLTRNVRKLHDGVTNLAAGNYATRVDVTSRDEVGRLATAFNQMAADIESHQKLAVEQERLKRELELCRQIQNDMLPHEPFRAALADVKGVSIPAREVGGDFFNYFTMGDGDLAVLVGDVSGKGVSAALTMANVQATLKARLPVVADLAKLVDSIDREFEKSSPRGVYATLFAAVLERSTRTLRYVNAGHHPQFVLRVDGSIVRLPSTGLPIGLLPGNGFVAKEIALNEGDLLFFYTDGAVETENEQGDMFGAERLEALLVAAHNDGVDAVLERAEKAVRDFRGSAEPFDDATLMALRVGR